MITQAILYAFNVVVTTLLGFIPNLPSFPTAVTNALATMNSIIVAPINMISYLYTPLIATFVFGLILVILNFDNIYKLVMFILHKVRG